MKKLIVKLASIATLAAAAAVTTIASRSSMPAWLHAKTDRVDSGMSGGDGQRDRRRSPMSGGAPVRRSSRSVQPPHCALLKRGGAVHSI
jgi:hypothetical protein